MTSGRPLLALVAARARGGVIGVHGQLPWHLPEDLKFFRETTRGKPVIMGRKTWESLPDAFRPLPGRHNIVVTRNTAFAAPGATVVASLEAAIDAAKDADTAFVIGGAEIFKQALPVADRLILTEIDHDYPGDTFFPEVAPALWRELSREPHTSAAGLPFAFVIYARSGA